MKKTIQQLKNQKGFTMVEVLVTVLIFMLISAGIMTIVNSGNDIWQMNKASVELQQELRKAMDWMMNDLREAGTSSIIDVPADGAAYTSITFSTPTGVSGGSLTWDASTINFALSSNQLIRTYGGTTRTLASRIVLLEFTRQAASSEILEVTLRGQRAVPGGQTIQRDLDFEVRLRN
jgi:prepilin-type N-terminal cleavage/methylation domain-containing protein